MACNIEVAVSVAKSETADGIPPKPEGRSPKAGRYSKAELDPERFTAVPPYDFVIRLSASGFPARLEPPAAYKMLYRRRAAP